MTPGQLDAAYRFADFVSEHVPVDLAEMPLWTDADWQAFTELFNDNRDDKGCDPVPDRVTRSAVVGILRERQTPDPFAAWSKT